MTTRQDTEWFRLVEASVDGELSEGSTTIDESMQRFNTLRDYMAVGGVAIAQELRMVMRNLGFKHSNEERNSWERSCSVHFDVYRIYSDI